MRLGSHACIVPKQPLSYVAYKEPLCPNIILTHHASCADWVEHVISTGGEPYLQTPEDEMSLFSLLLLDVACLYIGAHAIIIGLLWSFMRAKGRWLCARRRDDTGFITSSSMVAAPLATGKEQLQAGRIVNLVAVSAGSAHGKRQGRAAHDIGSACSELAAGECPADTPSSCALGFGVVAAPGHGQVGLEQQLAEVDKHAGTHVAAVADHPLRQLQARQRGKVVRFAL